ncbi:ROK family protein [Sciscionella sediminilitoris]|uniref:ROK family protein n=1 Tax=Sciscionella sediminilitoris TaxID=1445613 RepID=UPI0018D0C558|nr:ROK family protein [Sciscionella sp. SE31]
MSSAIGQGRDPASLRRHNLRALLRHLHLHGPTSRPGLCEVTGLTRSTIGDLVGELLSRELVREEGAPVTVGRGRPPLVVTPHEDAYVLGIAVEVDTIGIGRMNIGGSLLDEESVKHEHVAGDPAASVRQLTRLIRRRISKANTRPLALGIAVPGIVDIQDGTIASAPNLNWRNVRLGEELRRTAGFAEPITVANEARLAALAEHRRGAGQNSSDLVYVSAEVGVGGGVINNGETLTGTSGYGGEIGHMITNPGGRTCRCGGAGCWETEIGADALLRHAGLTDPADRHAALADLLAEAEREDAAAIEALRALCPSVATGLVNLINIFNPERIILGGLLRSVANQVGTELDASVRKLHGLNDFPVSIHPAQLGELAPLLGAAEHAVDSFLRQL